ncbi:MAG: hypothetical protein PHE09_21200 [Oscillospiraceae bacterium]|nr:hypothetical protein [Oscillospiraceae bacterium]
MKIVESHKTDVDNYIITHHYLHSAPAGARLRLWIKDDSDNVIGAMMWGRPTARTYDYNRILELTRLYLIDDTEHCAESKALGMARKYIRKHLPEIRGLISYSSTGEGHKGTVYLADGWFAVGTTRAAAWNKQGRKNIDKSKKIRWVRSV